MWLNFQTWLKERDFVWRFKLVVCLPIFALLTGLDWLTKGFVVQAMAQGESKTFIPHFLRLNYVINPGAAYGSNSNSPTLAITIATFVTLFLLIFFLFVNNKRWLIALTFLFSGGFANLLGRAWAPAVIGGFQDGFQGGVVDFLQWEIKIFNSKNYIFNLADIWVTIGVVILLVVTIWEIISFYWNKNKKDPVSEPESLLERQTPDEN